MNLSPALRIIVRTLLQALPAVLGINVRIYIAHEVGALGTIAILNRKAHSVQR